MHDLQTYITFATAIVLLVKAFVELYVTVQNNKKKS